MALDECPCGSGEYPSPLTDARGIFCAYVCEQCEHTVRKRYRSDIFTDPHYEADEPIEPEE